MVTNRQSHLIDCARSIIQSFRPKDDKPYWGCFSGGKDSVALKEIIRLSGVPVVWHYNVTTIDPPEVTRFIRDFHPDVIWERPTRSFWRWMMTQGFPTRRQRWCCKLLKESRTPKGERLLFGIRADESPRRAKNWQQVTTHRWNGNVVVSPLLYWTEADVWHFIRSRILPYCPLYDEGFNRIGCIGCPMGTRAQRERQFDRWPGFERRYRRAFKELWEKKHGTLTRAGRPWFGDRHFDSWEQMWQWWISNEPIPDEKCQGFLELFSS